MGAMLWVLALLAAGVGLGRLLRSKRRLVRLAERATHVAVYGMLALLGLSVGARPEIVRALPGLGAQAALLAAGTVLASVPAGWAAWRLVAGKGNR